MKKELKKRVTGRRQSASSFVGETSDVQQEPKKEQPPTIPKSTAGFKDKLVKPEGTIELFNSLTCEDVVGDGEHLLLEENQLTRQLKSLLVVWLRDQVSRWRAK